MTGFPKVRKSLSHRLFYDCVLVNPHTTSLPKKTTSLVPITPWHPRDAFCRLRQDYMRRLHWQRYALSGEFSVHRRCFRSEVSGGQLFSIRNLFKCVYKSRIIINIASFDIIKGMARQYSIPMYRDRLSSEVIPDFDAFPLWWMGRADFGGAGGG